LSRWEPLQIMHVNHIIHFLRLCWRLFQTCQTFQQVWNLRGRSCLRHNPWNVLKGWKFKKKFHKATWQLTKRAKMVFIFWTDYEIYDRISRNQAWFRVSPRMLWCKFSPIVYEIKLADLTKRTSFHSSKTASVFCRTFSINFQQLVLESFTKWARTIID